MIRFLICFIETSEHLIENDTEANKPDSCDAQNEPPNCEELLCETGLETSEAPGEEEIRNTVSNEDSITSLSQVTISLTSGTRVHPAILYI